MKKITILLLILLSIPPIQAQTGKIINTELTARHIPVGISSLQVIPPKGYAQIGLTTFLNPKNLSNFIVRQVDIIFDEELVLFKNYLAKRGTFKNREEYKINGLTAVYYDCYSITPTQDASILIFGNEKFSGEIEAYYPKGKKSEQKKLKKMMLSLQYDQNQKNENVEKYLGFELNTEQTQSKLTRSDPSVYQYFSIEQNIGFTIEVVFTKGIIDLDAYEKYIYYNDLFTPKEKIIPISKKYINNDELRIYRIIDLSDKHKYAYILHNKPKGLILNIYTTYSSGKETKLIDYMDTLIQNIRFK